MGAVLGLANFVPSLCVGLYQAFLHQRPEEARDLQQRLLPLGQKIGLPYGVPGIKAALDLCGYHGGVSRPPLLPISAKAKKQIAAALREANAALAV